MIRVLPLAGIAILAVLLLLVWLEPRPLLGVVLLVFLAHRGRRLVRAEVKRQKEVDH